MNQSAPQPPADLVGPLGEVLRQNQSFAILVFAVRRPARSTWKNAARSTSTGAAETVGCGLPINPPAHFKRPFLGANLRHPILAAAVARHPAFGTIERSATCRELTESPHDRCDAYCKNGPPDASQNLDVPSQPIEKECLKTASNKNLTHPRHLRHKPPSASRPLPGLSPKVICDIRISKRVMRPRSAIAVRLETPIEVKP